jgi:hypothetical protein
MALDISDTVRNAMLDSIETAIGASPICKIRTGAPPGIGAADTGTVLATINLPADWMSPASGGSKAKSGTWQDASADASGTAAHFRIYASDGVTQHIEGTAGMVGTEDLVLDNNIFAAGQQFTITTFTLNAGN